MPAGRSGASGEGPGRWWGEDAGDPSRPELPPGPEALPPAPARTPGRGRLVPDDCAGRDRLQTPRTVAAVENQAFW